MGKGCATGVGGSSFWYMESSGGEDLVRNGKSRKVCCLCVVICSTGQCGMDTSSKKKKPEQNFPLDCVCGTVNTCFTGGIL